jgi:hypothetical protein
MDREIVLERSGDVIHLILRHCRGPFTAKVLADRLHLVEVDPPANGGSKEFAKGPNGNGNHGGNGHNGSRHEPRNGWRKSGLRIGQYYELHPDSQDAEAHALLPSSLLGEIGRAAGDLHIPVIDAADLAVAAPAEVNRATAAGFKAIASAKNAAVIRKVMGGFAASLVLVALAGAAGVLAWRTWSREEIAPSELVARTGEPSPPPTGLVGRMRLQVLARGIRIPLGGILFVSSNKLVLADGGFVAVEGAGDLHALAPLAAEANALPVIEARIARDANGGPVISVDRIRCGRSVFAKSGTVLPIATLEPSLATPARAEVPRSPKSFRIVSELRFDRSREIQSLVGKRISVTGRLTFEDSRRVVRLANGTGLVLTPLPVDSHVEPFLAGLVGDPEEIQFDLILQRMLPWTNRVPTESRKQTQIAGEARVMSISAQSLFLKDY